ncbi:type VI secretion system baseplate subunit TssK [Sorangium sp. So ce375]|uniref:type VI secretion system baseplate subunit TssK n=1 Tax=Sorangium sp. So ce375 TaxID=3133306 RepID=UPI003F5B2012
MAASTLARPTWRIGQILLPEHFFGLEAALAAEAALRAGLSAPSYGVARLEWNGDDPTDGVLWLTGLTAVLPEGALVDVPGNARVRAPLDLKESGRREVEVFAHVLDSAGDGGDGGDGDEGEAPMELPSPREIPRAFHVIELSTERALTGARGRVPLGRFTLQRGAFRLDEASAPPLLRLDTTPYLTRALASLRGDLASLESALDARAIDALGRGESLGPVQRVRLEARKLAALLEDLERGVPLHPYAVFSALRAFSLDIYLLEERDAPWRPPAYDHDAPARCFGEVLAHLGRRMAAPQPSSPAIAFLPDNGRLVVAEVPDEALSAPEVYVAVLKARAADRVPLEGVRLASPSRLRIVREHALRGLRLTPTSSAPFRHGFGGAVDFYRVVGGAAGEEGGEWAHATRERALAFHPPPHLEGHQVVLCWRRP